MRLKNLARETVSLRYHFAFIRVCQRGLRAAPTYFILSISFVPLAAGKGTLRLKNFARETVSFRYHFAFIRETPARAPRPRRS